MIAYVTFGGMLATTWVQIIKAILLLSGATFMAVMVLAAFGFSPTALFNRAIEVLADSIRLCSVARPQGEALPA